MTAADDADVSRLTRRVNQTITLIQIAEAAAIVVLIGLVAYLVVRLGSDEAHITAACSFWSDLGNTVVNPRATQEGVGLVVHARDAFHGSHCPGSLTPPSGELLQLAQKFGFSVRY